MVWFLYDECLRHERVNIDIFSSIDITCNDDNESTKYFSMLHKMYLWKNFELITPSF